MPFHYTTYIIFAFITALLVALFQYFKVTYIKDKYIRFVLIALKTISITAIIILLLDIYYENQQSITEKPPLYVLLDNSESIKSNNLDNDLLSTYDLLNSSEALSEKYDIKFFSFGETLQVIDSLSFDKKESNLELALKNLPVNGFEKKFPIVVVTDGNLTNMGLNISQILNRTNIFPIIVGDTTKQFDLEIKQINHNKYSRLNSKLPLEIILNSQLANDLTANLDVVSENEIILSKQVKFSKTEKGYIFRCSIPTNKIGDNFFEAILSSNLEEGNKKNNIKKFSFNVIDNEIDIKLISAITHPDIGAIKRALESFKNISLTISSPSEKINLNKNDIVILYQPNISFINIIDELVKTNTSYCLITGNQTDFNFINNFQSVYRFDKNSESLKDIGSVTLNSNFSLFNLDSLNFSQLPPLKSPFNLRHSSSDNHLIYSSTLKEHPIVSMLDRDFQRVVIINGEDLWKWRFQFFQRESNFKGFDYMFNVLMQYLYYARMQKSRIEVNYSNDIQHLSNQKLTVKYYDKNFSISTSDNLSIKLKENKTGKEEVYSLYTKQNYYYFDVSLLKPGQYSFEVYTQNNEDRVKGSFVVYDFNFESQIKNSDIEFMKKLTQNSNGNIYTNKDKNQLIEYLINTTNYLARQNIIKSKIPLIEINYLLIIIIFSLSLEWILRKYFGEI